MSYLTSIAIWTLNRDMCHYNKYVKEDNTGMEASVAWFGILSRYLGKFLEQWDFSREFILGRKSRETPQEYLECVWENNQLKIGTTYLINVHWEISLNKGSNSLLKFEDGLNIVGKSLWDGYPTERELLSWSLICRPTKFRYLLVYELHLRYLVLCRNHDTIQIYFI